MDGRPDSAPQNLAAGLGRSGGAIASGGVVVPEPVEAEPIQD